MGVDFAAILDVAIDWPDLPPILERLDGIHDRLAVVWGGPFPNERRPRWELTLASVTFVCGFWDEVEEDTKQCRLLPLLQGPWDFAAVVRPRVVWLGNGDRWHNFVENLEHRERLRRTSLLIASAIGSRHVAYLSDHTFYQIEELGLLDGSFGPIVSHLQKTKGNPSSLASAYEVKWDEDEQYFVEPVPPDPTDRTRGRRQA